MPSLSKRIRITFLLSLLATLILPIFLQANPTSALTSEKKDRILESIDNILNKRAFALEADFSEWNTHIETHRTPIAEAQTPEAFAKAVRKALSEFGVSHTNVSPPVQTQARRQAKQVGLIGIYMSEHEEEYIVNKIARSSPAYAAGIRKLDTIVKIDGHPPKEAHKYYKPDATTRKLKWIRNGISYEKSVSIYPFTPNDPPSLRWIGEDIAVIEIMSFASKQYHRKQTSRLLKKVKNAKGVILDLRGNFGGLTYNYRHLASRFISNGKTFNYRIDKPTQRRSQKKLNTANPSWDEMLPFAKKIGFWRQGFVYQGPIVVLIDEYCASGGDLFPAVLKEQSGATLIGRKTEGALIASRTKALPFGYSLQHPIYEIATPEGRRLEGNGQKPDIALSVRETADDEYIFKLAVDEIERKLRREQK
ncbi:S41 family peptidase [Puniceicoccaceae bacterium K14]|nr:S41 family peptidase [Puniceicoccaceae bacterium K14]